MNKYFATFMAVGVLVTATSLSVLVPNGNWLYLFGLMLGTAITTVSFACIKN